MFKSLPLITSVVSALCLSPAALAETIPHAIENTPNYNDDKRQTRRRLGGKDILFNPRVDKCKTGIDLTTGRDIIDDCVPEDMFPKCKDDEFICFNRVNRLDKFWSDKVPHYIIDPRRIYCYPMDFLEDGGCSTCTPGRYCLAENRCILDERRYPCEEWL
mmetsp:Transcript_60701/g.72070  ORF Transcript_60701/g.72070 Transcript_60701/m.72070 type:complete len:160 (-) Transcript_60701:178-657(-)